MDVIFVVVNYDNSSCALNTFIRL